LSYSKIICRENDRNSDQNNDFMSLSNAARSDGYDYAEENNNRSAV